MSVYPYYSDYSKQATQFRCDQNLEYNLNSFQWPQSDPINQNKQNNTSEAVASYPAAIRELPKFDQEMLSWYQTVPLRHDPQDFDGNRTIQELQLNRKGKKCIKKNSLIIVYKPQVIFKTSDMNFTKTTSRNTVNQMPRVSCRSSSVNTLSLVVSCVKFYFNYQLINFGIGLNK